MDDTGMIHLRKRRGLRSYTWVEVSTLSKHEQFIYSSRKEGRVYGYKSRYMGRCRGGCFSGKSQVTKCERA